MAIFQGAYHLRKYFENDMESDTNWVRSETGSTINITGLVYLHHFKLFTNDSSIGNDQVSGDDGKNALCDITEDIEE
ncbi:hypothetical protein GcM1_171008 [Golovinomyces cichoracearum]|uniref:Uncharacterized protein n=1 Tax=Golovinomyces cichoracearum TaxID=62708 RepID=A0A420J6S6_9PEZI|nr:hypothetical protein GcM1_171008 [Golovinomyces cichoracearum]